VAEPTTLNLFEQQAANRRKSRWLVAGFLLFFLWLGLGGDLALFLYGVLIDLDSSANFVSLNEADNWLHLALGAGMVLLGSVLRGRTVDVRDHGRA